MEPVEYLLDWAGYWCEKWVQLEFPVTNSEVIVKNGPGRYTVVDAVENADVRVVAELGMRL